ncbi:Peptidase S46 [Porphyromonas macacae]|uniref:Dipeptidyl-peptidase n=1 Tax=Porphyromonas macacae TaxID=28115 RepID=A0A379E8B0_9PORP|nr:S46 family peptidase [Porphyromonas macacae]SUB88916.1 Peptidase S46 [Porphyromonas macacae]
MKKNRILSLFLVLSLGFVAGARADEGMWLLQQLAQKHADMQKRGLKLKQYDIYNPDGTSLKDAVVIFDRGCTGEVVSDQGLVLTNHHCGYDAIQQLSSIEHNYLEDGYWAMSLKEELPAKGVKITFIDKIEDVTGYVKAELSKNTDPNSMDYLSPRYLKGLAVQKVGKAFLDSNPGVDVEIKAFYDGNKYLMFTTKTYSDIRFVGAPPSSIGKFGSDTDNWMWPRHTGDFSVFRIYADAKGNPAPYSENNVPLRPKRWLNISTQGVKEGSFAMIMGFPGTTHRFYTPAEVDEWKSIDNDIRIRMRAIRQDVMLEQMLADPQIKIMYAAKYAYSQNGYKRAIGANWAIDTKDLRAAKAGQQDDLLKWSKSKGIGKYDRAVRDISDEVSSRKELRRRLWYLDEGIIRSIEFTMAPMLTEEIENILLGSDESKKKSCLEQIRKAFEAYNNKDYSTKVDKLIAKAVLTEYTAQIPEKYWPASLRDGVRKHGSVNACVDYMVDNSVMRSLATFDAMMELPAQKLVETLKNDPVAVFARDVAMEYVQLKKSLAPFDDPISRARRTYVGGLLQQHGDTALWPDANFTMRFTYGMVKGYSPKDGVRYGHQTYLYGVMEKEDPNNWEFVVPEKLKTIFNRKDYGRWGMTMPDGSKRMPIAFCATTHTTGGNSGSPVLDAYGNLIGLNFDRNWEGVGGDIQYLPDYQRSIIVDIRYVMLIIQKYGGCQRLIDEMTFSKK